MSYNLLSDCFICDLQLLVVLTASERHSMLWRRFRGSCFAHHDRKIQNNCEIDIFCFIANPLKALLITRVLIGFLKQTISMGGTMRSVGGTQNA